MRWFEAIAAKRPPDFVIGGAATPYMRRWWIIPRNRFFNIYLHQFLRSDDDRALHDHPWINLSILLDGDYTEHTIEAGGVRKAVHYSVGDWKFRRAKAAHRIEIESPCWSLFITGPIVREWGFHCPNGWRPWQLFVDQRDSGSVGRGCE
jgi:hypothetical protein